ncbi:hypothetical protein SLEP1_g24818 [Rubroshorea leprosula]|uniref:Uncharacterized protein n=1 Tax=Rubroshorea leprosula TaxID=152421 RepID=A0AAV5JN29_9ROSI|nr:hypothetical protein SLEP1_g24818 [Rubroshorea leprosula]
MFGRVRAPSSSPESLERPPPKIIKDDPLSVYEATLMKLRVGSQRHLHSLPEAARDVDGDCSSVTVSESPTSPSSPCAEMMTIESNHISANLLRSSENVSLNEEVIMMDTDDSVERREELESISSFPVNQIHDQVVLLRRKDANNIA